MHFSYFWIYCEKTVKHLVHGIYTAKYQDMLYFQKKKIPEKISGIFLSLFSF